MADEKKYIEVGAVVERLNAEKSVDQTILGGGDFAHGYYEGIDAAIAICSGGVSAPKCGADMEMSEAPPVAGAASEFRGLRRSAACGRKSESAIKEAAEASAKAEATFAATVSKSAPLGATDREREAAGATVTETL